MVLRTILLLTFYGGNLAVEEENGYRFNYEVDSLKNKVHFGHSEERQGSHTVGSYKVLLPDGRTQVVEYNVLDKASGYSVKVTYEGVAKVTAQPVAGYKTFKREIAVGAYRQGERRKPYARNIQNHISDIYTTIEPVITENVTVIPSPEIVTDPTRYDIDQQDSIEDIETTVTPSSKSINSTLKNDKYSFNNAYKPAVDAVYTSTVPALIGSITVLPSPEVVTSATTYHTKGYNQQTNPKTDKDLHFKKNNFNQQSESDPNILGLYFPSENAKRDHQKVKVSADTIKFKEPNVFSESFDDVHTFRKPKLSYEYNFKPVQEKTIVSKIDERPTLLKTANKKYHVIPKVVNKNEIIRPITNPIHFFPNSFKIKSTSRSDIIRKPKKTNEWSIFKNVENPFLSLKKWFPFIL